LQHFSLFHEAESLGLWRSLSSRYYVLLPKKPIHYKMGFFSSKKSGWADLNRHNDACIVTLGRGSNP
ncbi:MAG: hypothetical protein JXB38_22595, partial [Anaerolineales bacterium]|nr:hypothetical protein [Anaerolineales bacterium]